MTTGPAADREGDPPPGSPARRPAGRRRLATLVMAMLGLLGVAGLTALGVWQLERRTWKLALIERVERRAYGPPVAAPGPAEWPQVSAARDEYRRVRVRGHFLDDRETFVQAATELGSGFWVLTPLRTDDGFVVLVNRGFVPPERRDPATRAAGHTEGETEVTGLLRVTEPHGGFLRANDPARDRWFSRDVAAIAAARGLGGAAHEPVAPYFIDAAASGDPNAWPRGGLTVLAFPNNHLVYALTWFAMALALAAALVVAWRRRDDRPDS